MDRGTSFDFLNTLFKAPFSFVTDTTDTWRTNRKMPRGPLSLLYWYSFQENRYSKQGDVYEWKDEDRNSPGSPREVMYLPDWRLSHYEKENSNAHTWKNKMVDMAGLKNIDALTRIFSFNMLYDSEHSLVRSQSRKTRPLSFSACRNSGLGYFARAGYCDEEVVTPKMLVTKPSMWSEVDGSPGHYLVACRHDEVNGQCKHILTEAVVDAAKQTMSIQMGAVCRTYTVKNWETIARLKSMTQRWLLKMHSFSPAISGTGVLQATVSLTWSSTNATSKSSETPQTCSSDSQMTCTSRNTG